MRAAAAASGDQGRLAGDGNAGMTGGFAFDAVAENLPPHLKIVFTCYGLFGPEFTAAVERLRRA